MKISPSIIRLFVQDNFSEYKELGNEIHVPSMFKLGADPSLHTNININKGVVHDFIAGQGWSFREFVKLYKNFDNIYEVNEYLLRLALKNIKNESITEIVEEFTEPTINLEKPIFLPSSEISLPEQFKPINNNKSFGALRARNYLKNRGIIELAIEKFNLHYCPSGYYRDRIIIPFYEDKKLIWWQARSYSNIKRWLNPLNVRKETVIFNIDNMNKICVLVEGVFDAIVIGGQALLGTELHNAQLDKLLKKKPEIIVVALDPDTAGYKNTEKVCEKIRKAKYQDVYVMISPLKQDLDEVGYEKAWQVIKENTIPWGMVARVKLKELLESKESREKRCLTI